MMDEIVWQLEHSVECDASPGFAWSYMTHVANWDDPPARFVLDGPFIAGAQGTTHTPGQALVHWRIQDVRPGQSYALATELDRATLTFEWRFDAAPGRGTTLTQRIVLSGGNAGAYAESIAASFGSTLPAGMRRIAAAISEAEGSRRGPIVTLSDVQTRRAHAGDAGAIALAHRDSIRSIGPAFYPPEVVDAWSTGLSPDIYVKAMEGGEAFFIATGNINGQPLVLGFSTHRVDDAQDGASVYVRGEAARHGIGTALLRLAEEHALAHGAKRIQIQASLAGVEFYKINGFEELGRGEAHLISGQSMPCVFMRKILDPLTANDGPKGGESAA